MSKLLSTFSGFWFKIVYSLYLYMSWLLVSNAHYFQWNSAASTHMANIDSVLAMQIHLALHCSSVNQLLPNNPIFPALHLSSIYKKDAKKDANIQKKKKICRKYAQCKYAEYATNMQQIYKIYAKYIIEGCCSLLGNITELDQGPDPCNCQPCPLFAKRYFKPPKKKVGAADA